MKKLFLFFILFGLLFSSYGWESLTDSNILTKPVVFSGNVIVGTEQGTVYAFNINTGIQSWKKTNLGGSIIEIETLGSDLVVVLENGTIYRMQNYGELEAKYELNSQVYGIDKYNEKIYISSKKGIAEFYSGINWIYENESVYTPPKVYQDKIVFGKDEYLICVNLEGDVLWEKEIAQFWQSKPYIDGSNVYIGSMNHYFYSVNLENGNKNWMFGTEGAINSESIVYGEFVYFGSNDGYLYSLGTNGEFNWKGKTQAGIYSTPIITKIGQENVVIIGSTDANLYGFSRNEGELIWMYSTKQGITDINVKEDQILASAGEYVYSIATDRSCIFTEPEQRTKVGYKEIEIQGKIFSQYENAKAAVNVNKGVWEIVSPDENGTFTYTLDPNLYEYGIIGIECKVADDQGQSSTQTELTLLKSTEFEQPEFYIDYPRSVNTGEEIIVYVYDSETRELISNFQYEINNETLEGNEKIELKIEQEGEIKIKLMKTGYKERTITIKVEQDFTLYIVGAVLLLIVIVIIWLKLRRPAVKE